MTHKLRNTALDVFHVFRVMKTTCQSSACVGMLSSVKLTGSNKRNDLGVLFESADLQARDDKAVPNCSRVLHKAIIHYSGTLPNYADLEHGQGFFFFNPSMHFPSSL